VYTGPILNDPLEMYVTPGNIATYKNELAKALADSSAYGPESIKDMRGYIQKMEHAKPYTFIPMDNAGISFTTRKKVYPYPKKVAIVYNHNTASSGESFIFDAMQSKKVITMGENSGGYTGYGNVFAVPVPGSDLTLGCTTTRYPHRRKFDGIGIKPAWHLEVDGNWLPAALKHLVN
jgi:hypothetical protein